MTKVEQHAGIRHTVYRRAARAYINMVEAKSAHELTDGIVARWQEYKELLEEAGEIGLFYEWWDDLFNGRNMFDEEGR